MQRKELYDLIWAETTRTVAKRFGISDVALHKTCRAARIPTPGLGYWAKKAAGKPVKQTPLPPRELGETDEVHFRQPSHHGYPERNLDAPDPPPPVFEETMTAVRDRLQVRVPGVTVPPLASKRLHSETQRLIENDARLAAKGKGSTLPWYRPIFEGAVGKRRLRLLNALFHALERGGAHPSVGRKQEAEITYTVGSQTLCLRLELLGVRRPERYGPSWVVGRSMDAPGEAPLCLEVGYSTRDSEARLAWKDLPEKPLESQLRDIVVRMIVLGEEVYREGALRYHRSEIEHRSREREERRRRAIEAERAERERQAALEKQRIEQLLAAARARVEAQEIRSFVDAVRLGACSLDISQSEIESWIEWALAQADRHDPLVGGRFLRRDEP